MHISTLSDSERMLCPHDSLNHFYGAFLLGLLWPVILTCLILSPMFVISQDPPICAHVSLSQDGLQQGHLWLILTSLPSQPPRSSRVGRVSLTLRMRNIWSPTFYLVRPQFSLSCPTIDNFGISVHREWPPPSYPGVGWDYLLSQPQFQVNLE